MGLPMGLTVSIQAPSSTEMLQPWHAKKLAVQNLSFLGRFWAAIHKAEKIFRFQGRGYSCEFILQWEEKESTKKTSLGKNGGDEERLGQNGEVVWTQEKKNTW